MIGTEMSTFALLAEAAACIFAVRTELALFFIAIILHRMLFGNAFPKAKVQKTKPFVDKVPYETKKVDKCCMETEKSPSLKQSEEYVAARGWSTMAVDLAAAHDRGDYRAVLRCWNSMKPNDQLPAQGLAHVVETMQRLKKDGNAILSELCAYLRHNANQQGSMVFVNRLLESMVRSLDTALVTGVVEALPNMGLCPDSKTYELLLHMHFGTRSFNEVRAFAVQMTASGIACTGKSQMVLLKTALQMRDLPEALARYRKVADMQGSMPTASFAPQHVAAQLVDLACREHQLGLLISEIEVAPLPISPEALNTMLAECSRAKDGELALRVKRLGEQMGVEKSSRTQELLIRALGSDKDQLLSLLHDLEANQADLAGVIPVVLSACSQPEDVHLANKLVQMIRQKGVATVPNSAILALARFYAEQGHAEKACDVFDDYTRGSQGITGLQAPWHHLVDSRTQRCIVSAALKCGREDISSLLLESSATDTIKHSSMIRNFAAKGNLEEAFGIFRTLEANGSEITNSVWNTILDACVECKDLRRAESTMRRMESLGAVDAVSYNTMIKAYLRHDSFDRAWGLLEEMRSRGCIPNQVTYNEFINALARGDRDSRCQQVWEVVDEMKRNRVQPNRITCSILLKTLTAKSANVHIMRTMQLTDSMAEPMDDVLLSSVAEACVRVGKPGILLQKVEHLRAKGVFSVSSAHTFGSLIKAYGCARNIAGAWRCWKEMRSQHVKPTCVTIGCMVEAVATNGDVDGGYELIMSLHDEQCRDQVNAVVFGSVLKGYSRSRRMERVWAVFREMISKNIEPSVATYNTIVDACTRNRQMEQVPGLLDEMKQQGLTPNLVTFSTMIKGFCQHNDMISALRVLGDLQAAGFKPDEIVYNTLLDGCAQAGLVNEGERLHAQMQQDGIPSSNYTLTVMVKLLGQSRRIDSAFELVDTITRKYRFKPNFHVCNALIQACLSSKDFNRAVETYEQMVHDHVALDPRIFQHLIRGLLAHGSAVKATSLIRAVLNLNGGNIGFSEGHRHGPEIDNGFLKEVISTLSMRGAEAVLLAKTLLADLRKVQPGFQVESSLEWRLAAACL